MSNIRNRDYFNQEYDYSDMRWGNITPTDIDGLIEYHNICYVLFETKYNNAELPRGQLLALERLTDDIQEKKPILTIIATHVIPASEIVDVSKTIVVKYRWKGKWRNTKTPKTSKKLADEFINWAVKEHKKQLEELYKEDFN
jgi:hypothetical protein